MTLYYQTKVNLDKRRGDKMNFKYTMICMKCEKTYYSISGIDDICQPCMKKIRRHYD